MHYFYNRKISRDEDGYVNLDELCAAKGKRLEEWLQLETSQKYLSELLDSMTDWAMTKWEYNLRLQQKLIISLNEDTVNKHKGNWGHPLVAIEIGRWIDFSFGMWCSRMFKTPIETGHITSHTAVEYVHAAVAVESLPEGNLKRLVYERLVDELIRRDYS